jgi:putative ATP-binding cassette transporter
MSAIAKLFSFILRWSTDLRFSRGMAVLVVVTGVLSGVASTGLIAAINAAINRQAPVRVLLWTFIGLCVALPVFRFLSTWLLTKLTQQMLFDLRLTLSRRILAAPLRELEKIGPAGLLATLTEDIAAIVGAVGNLPLLILHLTVVFGCLVYLGVLSWQLLLLVLGFMVVGIISYQLPLVRAQRFFRLGREAWDSLFQSLRGLTEGTKELKIHAPRREAFISHLLGPSADQLRHASLVGNTFYAAANSWGQILFFVVIGLVLFAASGLLELTTPAVTGFILVLLYMMTPLDVLLNMLPGLGRATVSAQKVEELGLSLRQGATDADPVRLPPMRREWRRIELVGVGHSYRQEDVPGVDDFILGPIDLTLEPGELVFVVGGNGSGKTTLAKLLIGLYGPEQGEVRLDQEPVTVENRDAYRQLFSVVFNDFYLFDRLIGIEHPRLDQEAGRYLGDLKLSHKVEVEDGKLTTIDLSQGQRKRLALLTAYLEDRPIYLFDEWAADQDPMFKKVFYTELLPDLRRRGKTVVVISHDDHYYEVADRIVKLNDGQKEYDGDRDGYFRELASSGKAERLLAPGA